MSDEYKFGKTISDLEASGAMVLAQALFEIQQTNLASGEQSRQLALDDLRDAIAQTSLTDTTADRLMKVGAFGLGGFPTDVSDAGDDLDNLVDSGWWFYDSGSANAPSAFGVVQNIGGLTNTNAGIQIAWNTSDDETYIRRKASGVWGSWQPILTGFDYPSDTAWTTATSFDNGWTGTVNYIKRAGWVTVILEAVDGSSATDDVLLTLPSSYRSATTIRWVASRFDESSNRAVVGTNGDVGIFGTKSTSHRGSVTYPVI
jgi:hypothetical protein